MTVKAAGKISYSQNLTIFLLKNPQTRLIIGQIDMITGQLSWKKTLCMAAWEFKYPLEQNFCIMPSEKYNGFTKFFSPEAFFNLSSI